jgi:hypothetical protein
MKKPVATPHDSVKRALAIWRLLLRNYRPRDFAIRVWDASQPRRLHLVLRWSLIVLMP